MDTVTAGKVEALFALFALTLIFGVLPFFLLRRNARSLMSGHRQEQVIKYVNCFGGGVFLGVLLLHLMVEGSEEFEAFREEARFDNEYPFFNLSVAAGFFTVAFMEFSIHSCLLGRRVEPMNSHGNNHRGDHKTDNTPDLGKSANKDASQTGVSDYYGSLSSQQTTTFCKRDHHHGLENEGNSDVSSEQMNKTTTRLENPSPSAAEGDKTAREDLDAACAVAFSYASTESSIRALLLLVAFSFHTIFDGLAIGLQVSSFQLWEMFTAIAIHKCIVAFCLGVELFSKYVNSPKKAFVWISMFCLMSPIGICIAISLTSDGINDKAKYLSSGILQGLAAGTFMYVTFLKILSHFWNRRHNRHFLDIFFALIGFGCMAGVKILDKD